MSVIHKQRDPDTIINEVTRHPTATVTRQELQATLLHYGADFLYFREGQGHRLKYRAAGPGIYLCWLEKAEG